LRAFITATQQDDNRVTSFMEVDAVSGTVMDAQLANSLIHRFYVSSMIEAKAIQAGGYQAAYPSILKLHSPFSICFGLFYLNLSTLNRNVRICAK
jgi:hypothetical protein